MKKRGPDWELIRDAGSELEYVRSIRSAWGAARTVEEFLSLLDGVELACVCDALGLQGARRCRVLMRELGWKGNAYTRSQVKLSEDLELKGIGPSRFLSETIARAARREFGRAGEELLTSAARVAFADAVEWGIRAAGFTSSADAEEGGAS